MLFQIDTRETCYVRESARRENFPVNYLVNGALRKLIGFCFFVETFEHQKNGLRVTPADKLC